jgi:hypothetical protein
LTERVAECDVPAKIDSSGRRDPYPPFFVAVLPPTASPGRLVWIPVPVFFVRTLPTASEPAMQVPDEVIDEQVVDRQERVRHLRQQCFGDFFLHPLLAVVDRRLGDRTQASRGGRQGLSRSSPDPHSEANWAPLIRGTLR